MNHYDIMVLGAGPGGYVAAIRAAQLGASVAVVEQEHIGGVCLNTGCIPTKTLVRNAQILHLVAEGRKRGLDLTLNDAHIIQAVEYKDQVVKQLTTGVRRLLTANGVDVFMGRGVAGAAKTLRVEGESITEYSYGKLVVATGSRPALPPVPGIDSPACCTSTELLSIARIPEHLVIIGGGVIGCEFASVFRAYASQVTIVEMLPRLLPGMDREISQLLQRSFRTAGIDMRLGCSVRQIKQDADQVTLSITTNTDEETLHADCVLVSTGRVPNLAGLEALGLELDRGFVKTDATLRTSNPDVYAIGDVTGRLLLAHAASAMGVRAVENIVASGGLITEVAEEPVDLSLVPSCVYTLPEIGAVGMTEEEVTAVHGSAVVGKFPLAASGKALAMGETAGMFKLVAHPETHAVLGAHLIGANATEIIAEATAYMRMGATLSDIGSTIHAHPTLSESLMEAAHSAEGRCIHLPPPRKR